VQEQPAGPPSLQDQWELVAWKTSSHSSKRILGQQLIHGASDLAASLDSSQLSSPLSVGSHKELSSRDLMLQGTGPSTTQAVVNANKIHMGVCIGAGEEGTRAEEYQVSSSTASDTVNCPLTSFFMRVRE
jgi:hypothetical protein